MTSAGVPPTLSTPKFIEPILTFTDKAAVPASRMISSNVLRAEDRVLVAIVKSIMPLFVVTSKVPPAVESPSWVKVADSVV